MQAIGRWIASLLFGWLVDVIRESVEAYFEKRRANEERKRKAEEALKKLEEAKSEQEVIDAGGNVLERP